VPTATVTGDLTYYDPGLGACGTSAGDNDMVCAVSRLIFDAAAAPGDSNPNHNPLCGRRVRVQRNAASVDLTVVDRCVACAATDLDLSPAAFADLADPALGRVTGTWGFLPT
jgi:hypothetical protein